MYRWACAGAWLPEEEEEEVEGCPLATAARCLTLFPPSGGGWGEEGGAGPGETDPRVERGWVVGGLAGSGTAEEKQMNK